MKTLTVIAGITMTSGMIGVLPLPAPTQRSAPISERRTEQRVDRRADVRDLLASARGVAPAVCALAADGASNGWGGYWDAPDLSIRADVHQLVRSIRSTALDHAESQALLDALGSDDPCVRHLAGTLIGRSRDRAFVPE